MRQLPSGINGSNDVAMLDLKFMNETHSLNVDVHTLFNHKATSFNSLHYIYCLSNILHSRVCILYWIVCNFPRSCVSVCVLLRCLMYIRIELAIGLDWRWHDQLNEKL